MLARNGSIVVVDGATLAQIANQPLTDIEINPGCFHPDSCPIPALQDSSITAPRQGPGSSSSSDSEQQSSSLHSLILSTPKAPHRKPIFVFPKVTQITRDEMEGPKSTIAPVSNGQSHTDSTTPPRTSNFLANPLDAVGLFVPPLLPHRIEEPSTAKTSSTEGPKLQTPRALTKSTSDLHTPQHAVSSETARQEAPGVESPTSSITAIPRDPIIASGLETARMNNIRSNDYTVPNIVIETEGSDTIEKHTSSSDTPYPRSATTAFVPQDSMLRESSIMNTAESAAVTETETGLSLENIYPLSITTSTAKQVATMGSAFVSLANESYSLETAHLLTGKTAASLLYTGIRNDANRTTRLPSNATKPTAVFAGGGTAARAVRSTYLILRFVGVMLGFLMA